MAIIVEAYDNSDNYVLTLEGRTIKSIFRQAQQYFGHCLGSVIERGVWKGWRFAHCTGTERCSRVVVVNIMFGKHEWEDTTKPGARRRMKKWEELLAQ